MQIKQRYTGVVLYESDAKTLRITVEDAVKNKSTLGGADLRGADLRGADLHGANLRGASLRGADLSEADLSGASLDGADLSGVNLLGADLRGADLGGADLRDADLLGADLLGADLRDADLGGADLLGADLRDANMCGAKHPRIVIRGLSFPVYLSPDGWVQVGCHRLTVDDWASLDESAVRQIDPDCADDAARMWRQYRDALLALASAHVAAWTDPPAE